MVHTIRASSPGAIIEILLKDMKNPLCMDILWYFIPHQPPHQLSPPPSLKKHLAAIMAVFRCFYPTYTLFRERQRGRQAVSQVVECPRKITYGMKKEVFYCLLMDARYD